MGNSPSRGTQVARQQARTRAVRTGQPVKSVPSTSARVQRQQAAKAAAAPQEDYTRFASREQERAVLRQAQAWGTPRYLADGQVERAVFIERAGRQATPVVLGFHKNADTERIAGLPSPGEMRALLPDRPEMLHTHPGWGGSLSDMDVREAIKGRWAAIHAVGEGPDGKPWLFTMRPGPAASKNGLWSWDSTYKKLKIGTTRQRIGEQVIEEMKHQVRIGRMTPHQMDNLQWHEIWTRVVREVGSDVLVYEARPLAEARRRATRVRG